MLAVSTLEALLAVSVAGAAAVAVIAWLLSGVRLEVGRAGVRASARSGSGDGASGSDRRAPTLDATPARRDR